MRTLPAILFILCVSMLPAWADEQADIKAVEEILEIEKQALEIRKRATDRANVAVNKSSLGEKCKRSHEAYAKANDDLKNSKAHREYLGEDKLESPLDYKELRKHNEEVGRRMRAYDDARKPVEALMDIYMALVRQCNRMKDKVFLIFLDDEIEKAVKSERKQLSRELKKMRTEYKSA